MMARGIGRSGTAVVFLPPFLLTGQAPVPANVTQNLWNAETFRSFDLFPNAFASGLGPRASGLSGNLGIFRNVQRFRG